MGINNQERDGRRSRLTMIENMLQPLYIGAMSGTSLDGVDAALVRLPIQSLPVQSSHAKRLPPEGSSPDDLPELLHAHHSPYSDTLRQGLLGVCQGQAVTLAQVGALDVQVARAYAQAVAALLQAAGVVPQQVRAIGAHGQTVHHQPAPLAQGERFSTQLGDPNTLAVATGITVVADFRRRDMALGGQGAPLAPGFHDRVLRHPQRTRVVLNCGGIANISLLVPGQPCRGYDTGPANMLLDAWVQQHRGQPYDADGAWAAQGQVHAPLLQALLADAYFSAPPPKSTGREYFGLAWLQQTLAALGTPVAPVDVQRTLLELSAASVAREITREGAREGEQTAAAAAHTQGADLLVCGGGARNVFFMQRLAALLPAWQVAPTDAFGVPAQWMEAMAFASFAQCTLDGVAANAPAVTGASRPCVLGGIYPP